MASEQGAFLQKALQLCLPANQGLEIRTTENAVVMRRHLAVSVRRLSAPPYVPTKQPEAE